MEETTIEQKLRCHECNALMVLLTSFGRVDPQTGEPAKYYLCARSPNCRVRYGASPDGKPLGILGEVVTHKLKCAECNSPMLLMTNFNSRYPKTGKPRKYYRCTRFPHCKGSCGAHPDGTPLGIPGDEDTRKARIELHRVFDQLWLTKRWKREEAYCILQILMGLDWDDAHIGKFSLEQCQEATEKIKEFLRLNTLINPTKGVLQKYRYVLFTFNCEEHGPTVHQVYLLGREKFCRECLKTSGSPVRKDFAAFTSDIYE